MGRCESCHRALCLSHQARDVHANGLVLRTYSSWCHACQEQSVAEHFQREATLKQAAAARHKEALKRIPELITRLNAVRAGLAEERVTVTYENRAFGRRKEVRHVHEPAIPIGDLYWRYTTRGQERYDPAEERYGSFPSGVTRSGDIVPMNPESPSVGAGPSGAWSSWGGELDLQHAEHIARLLELALRRS